MFLNRFLSDENIKDHCRSCLPGILPFALFQGYKHEKIVNFSLSKTSRVFLFEGSLEDDRKKAKTLSLKVHL